MLSEKMPASNFTSYDIKTDILHFNKIKMRNIRYA